MTLQKIIYKKDIFNNKNSIFINNEELFQQLVKQELPAILSNDLHKKISVYKCVFKFRSNFGNAMPDLIAIADDYSYFAIIEVEISNHSFDGHVEVQIKSLVNSNYTNYEEALFNHIVKHNQKVATTDFNRFREMLDNIQPEFIVVAEKYIKEWQIWLEAYKTRFISISPHLNEQNEYTYLVTDSKVPEKSSVFKIEWIKYFFQLKETGNTYFENDSRLELEIDERVFQFSVSRGTKTISLIPLGSGNIIEAYDEAFLNNIKTIECSSNSYKLIKGNYEN